jgi:hypothetical protein
MPEPPKRYSLSSNSSAKPSTTPPAKAAAPVNTSTFLTRIANQAVREGAGGPAPQQGSPRFINSSIDHSSPAANLNSRLKWVETAFKTNEGGQAQPVQRAQIAQSVPTQTATPQAADFKAAVELMRKRLQNIHVEMEVLDKELAEIQQRMQ